MVFKSLRIISTALVLLFASSAASRAQDEARYKELPNFHQVNSTLYRGGQPRAGGFERLAGLGIKTVLNLRDDDEREQVEEKEVRAAGLRYFNIPLDGMGRPSDEKVERALAIINAPENQPVFVHCKRGSDRTGTVIAVYRIAHDGWTSEQAKAEAKRYGMGFWEVGMKDYIRDYYERRTAGKAKVSRWSVEQRRLVVV
ncbi:MAG: tyrosine-protein phosphatase [Pyrinomonadaceae bacterium]|nr:tyrosine-protein phosphatase [Pyrinomonadaceae bacterium]